MDKTDEQSTEQAAGKVVVKAKYRSAERAQVFLGIVSVLVILLLIMAGWYWWKSSQIVVEREQIDEAKNVGVEQVETARSEAIKGSGSVAQWATYGNDELALNFKYPEGWQVTEVNGGEGLLLISMSKEELNEENLSGAMPLVMQVIEEVEFEQVVIEAQEVYEKESVRERRLDRESGGVYLTGDNKPEIADSELVQAIIPWDGKVIWMVFTEGQAEEFTEEVFRKIVDSVERK